MESERLHAVFIFVFCPVSLSGCCFVVSVGSVVCLIFCSSIVSHCNFIFKYLCLFAGQFVCHLFVCSVIRVFCLLRISCLCV